MVSKKPPEEFSETEAQERFEKALRGGLKKSPTALKDVPKKTTLKTSKKEKK